MSASGLAATARALVGGDKGLLAMDESNATCDQRFAAAGITQTEPSRRAYREMIVTTLGLGATISGAILYDETIRQHTRDGNPFAQAVVDAGIIPGIKVDIGETDLAGHPGDQFTEGLDGLASRLVEYQSMGARFAKWRAEFPIGVGVEVRSRTGYLPGELSLFSQMTGRKLVDRVARMRTMTETSFRDEAVERFGDEPGAPPTERVRPVPPQAGGGCGDDAVDT